jgi:hypothetical protein
MPAILKQHVHYQAAKADDSDALLWPGEALTGDMAKEFGLSSERIRQLCRRHGCGRWIGRLRLYAVDRQKLTEVLARPKRRRRKRNLARPK